MAHQGGKLKTKEERNNMFIWLEKLEFDLLELPEADIKIFLHMPFLESLKLKEGREEKLDQNEEDKEHLLNAEIAYKELAEKYNFKIIECTYEGRIKSIDEIQNELYSYVKSLL